MSLPFPHGLGGFRALSQPQELHVELGGSGVRICRSGVSSKVGLWPGVTTGPGATRGRRAPCSCAQVGCCRDQRPGCGDPEGAALTPWVLLEVGTTWQTLSVLI